MEQRKILLKVSVFLTLLPSLQIEGAKVLLLPMIGESPTSNFAQVGAALVDKGYKVYAYVNGDYESTRPLTDAAEELITYNNTLGGCVMESEEVEAVRFLGFLKSEYHLRDFFTTLSSSYPLFKAEVQASLDNERVLRKMKKMQFDAVVVDGDIFNKHMYVVAHYLDKPIVSMVSVFNPYEAGLPALPSMYASINAHLTEQMTFFERLSTLSFLFIDTFVMPAFLPMYANNLVSQYAPGRPYRSLSRIAGETKLWLCLSDSVVDYTNVTLPRVINVGGLNTRPAEPLPSDVSFLADQAEAGVIVMSFGSHFLLPKRLLRLFLGAFGKLRQTVFLHHTGATPGDVPPNVHLLERLPQSDLLGHRHARLFITDCSLRGQFEAIYHGVPMLGLPTSADEMNNARRMEYHGLGFILDFRRLTAEELVRSIEAMLADSSYAEKAKLISHAFRGRSHTPLQTATHWIEQVIKTGGDNLPTPGAEVVPPKLLCLDILAFVLKVSVAVCYVLSTFCCCLWGSCCRRKFTPPQIAKEKTQ